MEKVKKYLNEILTLEETVIVSCSGGPDSMCLLSLICDLKEVYKLNIICAHVNHNVREESEEEEQFLREYCNKKDIAFELLTIKKYKDNFHNDARVQRYNFLENIVKKYKSKKLFTAHHGDDLIETILMRITRGSNLTGYAGFKVNNKLSTYEVIRPLIYTTKDKIIKYNNSNNIEYRIDKTNSSPEYTRNRYRHKILPILKEEYEDVHLKYMKFSKKLYEYDKFIKEYIIKKNIIEKDNVINIIYYNEESEFIKERAIELLISNIQQENEFYVTDNIIKEIKKLIKSQKGKGSINLPNGFNGYKENKHFFIKNTKNVL